MMDRTTFRTPCPLLAALLCASIAGCAVQELPPRQVIVQPAPPVVVQYTPPPAMPLPATIVRVYADPPLYTPQPLLLDWAPPPRLVENTPPMPYYGAVWVGGYWVWQGMWVWASGRWASPPSPRHAWMPPRYEPFQGRLRYQPGHWAASNAAPIAYPPAQPEYRTREPIREQNWEQRREADRNQRYREDRRDDRRDDRDNAQRRDERPQRQPDAAQQPDGNRPNRYQPSNPVPVVIPATVQPVVPVPRASAPPPPAVAPAPVITQPPVAPRFRIRPEPAVPATPAASTPNTPQPANTGRDPRQSHDARPDRTRPEGANAEDQRRRPPAPDTEGKPQSGEPR